MKNKGFTLMELIVVMAVFLFIIGAAIGIFISIIQNQRRILSQQELLNQASYAEEYMSKALRMATRDTTGDCLGLDYQGYNYLLTRPADGFYTGIKFLNQSNTDSFGDPICQEFYLDTAAGVLKEIKNGLPSDGVPLTSEKLKINFIRFSINGGNGADNFKDVPGAQPRITITLDIQIEGDAQPAAKIQTTVSQRNINMQ
jgi:prepilin-type N-terminal cleavage/methylation domain-containing protein